MKRFYDRVLLTSHEHGFKLYLDEREVKTPGKKDLIIPARILAEMVADEWRDQDTEIIPATMPFTQFVYTSVDRVAIQRDMVIDEMVGFGNSDLVCYRAEEPDELKVRQSEVWDPYLAFVEQEFGANLKTTTGIIHVAQSDDDIGRLRRILETYDNMALTALFQLVNGFGSIVIALSLIYGFQDFDAAWRASQLDEDFQSEAWGRDSEDDERLVKLKAGLQSAYEFFLALSR